MNVHWKWWWRCSFICVFIYWCLGVMVWQANVLHTCCICAWTSRRSTRLNWISLNTLVLIWLTKMVCIAFRLNGKYSTHFEKYCSPLTFTTTECAKYVIICYIITSSERDHLQISYYTIITSTKEVIFYWTLCLSVCLSVCLSPVSNFV